jgi:hypothetical protein
MNDRESRILALENRLLRLPALDLERRLRAVEEMQRVLWLNDVDEQPPASGLLVTVTDLLSLTPEAGVTVTVKDHTSGTVEGTGTTASDGTYFFAWAVSQTFDVVVSGTGYSTQTITSVAVVAGATTALPVAIAWGIYTAADGTYGNVSMFNSPATRWQSSGQILSFTASGGCSSAASVPVTYKLVPDGLGNGTLTVLYPVISTSNTCPVASFPGATDTITFNAGAWSGSDLVFTGIASTSLATQKWYSGTPTITVHR